MANVEKFVEHGLSLKPETYNFDVPFFLFDFPLFQWLVAGACQVLKTDALSTARVIEMLVFVLAFFTLDRLLEYVRVGRTHRLVALSLFVYAPLDFFYFETPMVDDVAILLSLLSLYGFVRWQDAAGSKRWAYFALMAGAGAASTLIKNPVYLPVFVATFWSRLRRGGWREVLEPGLALFAAVILSSVVVFNLYDFDPSRVAASVPSSRSR